ncbi:MAG: phosphopantothenoylcysteine decarboxylase, partial [Clostridiales bacterium]|nr:phosphopantothenoylcysteine decarboxylase [Clostridiales bacterium]
KVPGAGFGVETNILTLIGPEGERELPLMTKEQAANALLDEILRRQTAE